MKDKIKYLIHKLFIYKEVNTKDPLVISCLINLLLKVYPDFQKEDITKIVLDIFETSEYKQNTNLCLTGYTPSPINCNDYNELYLAIKKSLICSDSFEP